MTFNKSHNLGDFGLRRGSRRWYCAVTTGQGAARSKVTFPPHQRSLLGRAGSRVAVEPNGLTRGMAGIRVSHEMSRPHEIEASLSDLSMLKAKIACCTGRSNTGVSVWCRGSESRSIPSSQLNTSRTCAMYTTRYATTSWLSFVRH